ncbi:MAG: glycosyltransferase [Candidatus Niyogibacteria bacterium]|nr:glycosyltransferase [Candidatus Niyogibacteria bacterium]
MTIKNFIYIANVRLPTEKAHGIQIMQMLSALVSNASPDARTRLVIPRRVNKITQSPFEYYGSRSDFQIKKLPCLDLMFLPAFKSCWFWIESVSFAFFATIYFLFERGAVFYTRDALIAAVFFLLGKVVFYEIHDLPDRASFLHKLAWEGSRGLVAISDGLRKGLMERGIDEKKIIVARDAVDVGKFDIRESQSECRKKLALPLDKKIILYSGHLYTWKGADVLLQAARAFPFIKRSEILFVFVGGTDEDVARFRGSVAGLPHILIAGHRPHQEIPFWLKAADILVMPNSAKEDISRLYTSPMKLFEYMAAGRPIIVSDTPSLREVLNENNAWLVRPDDPDAIVNCILDILDDLNKADVRAKRAQAEAREYTWDKRVIHILSFVEDLIKHGA